MKGNNPLFTGMSGKLGDWVVSQVADRSVVRPRKRTNSSRTPAQVESRLKFGATAQSWKNLTEAGRQSYKDLGTRMKGKSGKAMTGSNCYASITNTRALLNLPPLEMAPSLPAQSPMMPSPTILSVFDSEEFEMFVHSPAAAGPFLLEATAYVSAGVASFPKSAFRVCGTLAQLAAGQTAIGADYLNVFTLPPGGSQVAVRLTPLTQTGFRGTAIVYTSFVADSLEAMQADLEERKANPRRRATLRMVG